MIWSLILSGTLAISLVVVLALKKDRIIQYFVSEANKKISTPIDVGKIDISAFAHFPSISIDLHNVIVKESYEQDKGILARAKKISFSITLRELLKQQFIVHGLFMSDAELTIKIDRDGIPNYRIFHSDSTSSGSAFELRNLKAENLKINYLDIPSDTELKLYVHEMKADLQRKNELITTTLQGSLISDEIRVDKRVFLNNKNIEIESQIAIELKSKHYDILTGNLQIDKGKFAVSGFVDASEKKLDLTVNGVNTSFRTINSLLSSDLSAYLREYNSRGDVYFKGQVSGNYGAPYKPVVILEFGANNAAFYHPKYKKEIKNVSLNGSFHSGKTNRLSNYRLELKNVACELDDKRLEGQLIISNFENYYTDLVLKGEADINSLALLFPGKYFKTAFGTVKMDIHLNGPLNGPKSTSNFIAEGDIMLQNVSFVLSGEKLPFNKLNGSLSLRKNDLGVSNLSGFVGQSDFRLNGYLKDAYKLLTVKDSPIKIQADLISRNIDFDELLKSNFASRDTLTGSNKKYNFHISPTLELKFNCQIDHLKFRRFNGRTIKGQLLIDDRIAILRNISFSSMGGRIHVNGSVNNKLDNLVETTTDANLYNINIDSIFYVFKNFNQDWLVDKNLKGQIDADVDLYMNFDNNLVLNTNSMRADITTSIINGELNDFEPMMKLSKFVEEESLARMRFSRLTNTIRIENRIIYIPEMEIRSNVSNILIKGQHTFDHHIDYRLQVPLKNLLRLTKKSDFEQSARSGMNLMLKITGTTSDYKVSYDTDALKQSIKNDFKDEKTEWKNLRNNVVKESEIPEFEEEYFEFEKPSADSSKKKNQ